MMATDDMFTQIRTKVGIKKFCEQAVAEMFKEFKNLNN